jgi:putative FmdB family regulatory protein
LPIYEYRCTACGRTSSLLWTTAGTAAPAAIGCEHCGGGDTHRIISRIAVHRTELSKLQSLDPKYDRMAEHALRSTPEADPDRLVRRMTPYSAADE